MVKIFSVVILVLFLPLVVLAQNNISSKARTAEAILEEGLDEKNPDKRKEVIVALSLEGANENVFSLLKKGLADKDVPVRVATCSTLSSLEDDRAIQLLKQALEDPIPEVSFAAAQGLWKLDQPAGKEVLMEILAGDKKPSSRYLTQQKRDAMRLMRTPGGLFKLAFKMGIGYVPVPGLGTGIDSMEALLHDGSISGRALAALLLSKDEDPNSLTLLREALKDKDWAVRAAAAHSLALRNQPEVRPDIELLFEDKKDQVRYRAAAAYLRLELLASDKNSSKNRSRSTKKTISRKSS